ncbi:MAG: PilZ domain-containing protein [Terracidiphilus sp.]
MAEFSHFRSSVARKVDEKIPGSGIGPGDRSNSEAGKYCAYNQTRQRFLCANVEPADVSTTGLDVRLPGITPSSGAGLWIVPIQIISPTSVRVPLDLIYLDRNSVVLDAVESFPLAQATASLGAATSILALPSQTIASTGTQPGDRLILCAPEEMKLRLQQIGDQTRSEQSPSSSQSAALANDRQHPKAVGNLIPFVDRSNPKVPSDIAPAATAPAGSVPIAPVPPGIAPPEIVPPEIAPTISAPTAPEPVAAPPQPDQAPAPRWKAAPTKSWLKRLISGEPSDPRKAPRTALPWLVAYFFTGGRPVPHEIRDISVTGAFVFTEDRWYPGTVVRMTLTDKRNPADERSFTINAEVIRAADDGVGFQFVLKDGKDSRHAAASGVDRQAQGVFRAQVEEFLLRMSSGAN